MKRLVFLLFMLCLCSSNLFAQRSASYGTIYPEGSSRDISPELWEKTTLYYYISNYSNNLNYTQCEAAIQSAFTTWADYSRFTFIQTFSLSQADIVLGWYTYNHGDYCDPFNNTSVVAHSTVGKISSLTPPGQVHFNDLCTFSTDGTQFDVESVALHEIGHVLGIPDNYTNSSYVMYYQISSGTIKRNLTSYDYNALYDIYGFPNAIEGPNYICSHDTCYINNLDKLPSNFTVSWSLDDSNYYAPDYLVSNCPYKGYCIIARNPNHDMTGATLTAQIKKNGTVIKTLTKPNMYAYSGFKGDYTSGNLSGNIDYTYFFNIRTNATTYIKSPNFYGATVSYSSSGATPSIWGFSSSNGDLTFVTTTPNAAVVINVTDTGGNNYTLYAYATSQYKLNVSNGYYGITVSVVEDGDSDRGISVDQPWTVEVRNAATGQLMATRSSTSRSETISTVGWPKGIYVVKATIGEEELTEKVIVK